MKIQGKYVSSLGLEWHRRCSRSWSDRGWWSAAPVGAARSCASTGGDSLGPGSDARVYPVDLSNPKAVDEVASRITAEVGTPDVLVNNAGAGRWKFVDETSPEEAIQYDGRALLRYFCITHAFLPAMIRRGSGHVVNVSSVASTLFGPELQPTPPRDGQCGASRKRYGQT
jgi:NAD(P)-dependent dehydrogenase (short-subunit alcohol dehydrogenase family)